MKSEGKGKRWPRTFLGSLRWSNRNAWIRKRQQNEIQVFGYPSGQCWINGEEMEAASYYCYTLQQDNNPKHKAKATQEGLDNKKVNVVRRPRQSPDFNPIENLWHCSKIAVQLTWTTWSNKNGGNSLPNSVQSWKITPKHFKVIEVNAATGGSTKY